MRHHPGRPIAIGVEIDGHHAQRLVDVADIVRQQTQRFALALDGCRVRPHGGFHLRLTQKGGGAPAAGGRAPCAPVVRFAQGYMLLIIVTSLGDTFVFSLVGPRPSANSLPSKA